MVLLGLFGKGPGPWAQTGFDRRRSDPRCYGEQILGRKGGYTGPDLIRDKHMEIIFFCKGG
jgi:hypothetical protein